MEEVKNFLEEALNKNSIILKDLIDIQQDMKAYLEKKDTLIYKNCSNIIININSIINKIELINCKNIILYVKGLISGINIELSNNINIKSECINAIKIYNSNTIKINHSPLSYKDIYKSYNIFL